ncbi:unnamed protein product [Ilex paraguariensis]|uniref:Uncharacterized protein n=1 Tax=Ilex paraguariensis TaxID=185542 RepID=A0ABC8UD01_9AQUA
MELGNISGKVSGQGLGWFFRIDVGVLMVYGWRGFSAWLIWPCWHGGRLLLFQCRGKAVELWVLPQYEKLLQQIEEVQSVICIWSWAVFCIYDWANLVIRSALIWSIEMGYAGRSFHALEDFQNYCTDLFLSMELGNISGKVSGQGLGWFFRIDVGVLMVYGWRGFSAWLIWPCWHGGRLLLFQCRGKAVELWVLPQYEKLLQQIEEV